MSEKQNHIFYSMGLYLFFLIADFAITMYIFMFAYFHLKHKSRKLRFLTLLFVLAAS